MITTSRTRFRFAVNTSGKDKNWDYKLLTNRYRDKEGTLEDVQRHVANGHALLVGLLGGKSRSKANVIGSDVLLLDIDNSTPLLDADGNPVKGEDGKIIPTYSHELTLEDALAHPFIQKYCCLIYTTPSHRPDWHKFRLIFLLPEYLEGGDTVEVCIRFLMQHLPHDPACKDAGRVFYGNSKAEFPLVQPGVTLPMEWVEEARAIAQEERILHTERIKQFEARKAEIRARNDAEGWDNDKLIQQALSFIPPRNPGSNTYDESLAVLMALVDYYGPAEAEAVAEQWSPSVRGTDWNVGRKIRSFKRGGTGIGSLFHIAKQYGFKFPAIQNYTAVSTPQDIEAAEDWEEGLDRYLNAKKLEDFLGKTLKRVKKFVSQAPKHLGVKGFAEKAQPKSDDNGVISFAKGDRQKLITVLVEQAAREGRKLRILDTSETGAGKSHEWGEISNGLLGIDKLFYCSPTHRNPSTSTVEKNFADLPVRHNGLLVDENKPQTALGNAHVRWAKKQIGEQSNITPNCKNAEQFHIYSTKGYHESVNSSAGINPICKKCKFALGCAGVKDEDGNYIMEPVEGYTFRLERQKVLKEYAKIRASLDSLPSITTMQEPTEEGQPGIRAGIIVDEFYAQYRSTNLTQVSLAEFDSTWVFLQSREAFILEHLAQTEELIEWKRQQLENAANEQEIKKLEQEITDLAHNYQAVKDLVEKLPGALETVKPIIYSIRGVLSGEEIDVTQETFYGWNELQLREVIGELPEGLQEAAKVLAAVKPRLETLLDGIEADSVSQEGIQGNSKDKKGSSPVLRYIRGQFNKEANQQKRDRIKNLPANCIVPILKTLAGERGSFRVKHGTLEIVTANDRHKEQLLAADLAVVLDATLTPQSLAQSLGIDPSEIVVICEERKSYSNLTIKHVRGLGKLTRNRSKELQERLDALLTHLEEKHLGLGIIDHLATKRAGDGHWFNDSRGTNVYQHKEALITIGSPYQDIGSLAMVYATTTGDKNTTKGNPKFDAYVQELKEVEVIQAGGRLRAHRRPDERLIWYIVTDEDINYLKGAFPGATFEEVSAFSITPDAGSEGERTLGTVFAAIAKLAQEDGRETITQAEVAHTAGLAQSTISKAINRDELVAKIGGWRGFRKLFQALLDAPRGWNNLSKKLQEEFGEDALFAIETYLPLVLQDNDQNVENLASECTNLAQTVGWGAIQAFLHLMPVESRVNMLSFLVGLLSDDWQEEFLHLMPIA
ncbi:PriCT-2 domain-containing protein [Brasilonema bromeliae]|uniref:Primase C-terminal 2 domain-containing protein n=1 Tax=Brasilonema bromeliae SPC951 TaxID=385972 RepID=A0ABX1P9R2_9CYAN|nr:PriCT-2 domain-containing protein [Brasilonema bromeliae]NMG20718.1 hypothetical protein [Brasilonema bromeliae SPC951]